MKYLAKSIVTMAAERSILDLPTEVVDNILSYI